MKKIIFPILLMSMVILSGCTNQTTSTNASTVKKQVNTINQYQTSSVESVADKLEVYYFHRTARCYSCKTIGQFTNELMTEKYSEEIQKGLIDFKEINVDLPENKAIAQKYQASGSSLFINRIIGDNNNIEQDTNVWRLLNNETQFKNYLSNKINSYLGIE